MSSVTHATDLGGIIVIKLIVTCGKNVNKSFPRPGAHF